MRHLLPFLLLCATLQAQTTVPYSPNTAAIANPERGFYHFTETWASAHTPLSQSTLSNLRNGYTASGANYGSPVMLALRVFYLDDFINSPISAGFLSAIETDFNTARAAGVKLIVRFAYNQDVSIPYNEPSKTQILAHITQLQPLLNDHADVILTLQAGFIGAWGEWYYTTVFGDASLPPYSYTATNWQDRIDLLNALLGALPASRQIQVRTPQTKQKHAFGVNAPINSAATGGRVAHHNDCFLAPFFDYGTYNNYDNGNPDSTALKPYLQAEAALGTIQGGETCDPNTPHSLCLSAGGRADAELKRFRYTYLNADYNNAVNNSWTPCIDNIKRQLGYRFVLLNGTYPNSAQPGGQITLQISLKNEGWAAPVNPRSAEIILRNTSTGQRYFAALNSDPQNWAPGLTQNISQNFCLPTTIPAGNYELLFNLPDPEPTLYERPEYAIQTANLNTWESSTGYNKLLHTLTVSGSTLSCSGFTTFSTSAPLPVEWLDFYAENMDNDAVRLGWSSALEQNLAYYEVQRSTDALAFETRARVSPRGAGAYTYLDKPQPGAEGLWYRIRSVDQDGRAQLSPLRYVGLKAAARLQVLGNPLRDRLQFQVTGSAGPYPYRLLSASGRVVAKGESEGSIELRELPAGMYFLEIRVGGKVLWEKVVRE
ncbi:MAG: DUF4832 domain-containing protein [Chitinophagales bacterium]|nr:DUF4832 domain-containing protein [Chitinophagales bacterium]